jgi:hypothetical protein
MLQGRSNAKRPPAVTASRTWVNRRHLVDVRFADLPMIEGATGKFLPATDGGRTVPIST